MKPVPVGADANTNMKHVPVDEADAKPASNDTKLPTAEKKQAATADKKQAVSENEETESESEEEKGPPCNHDDVMDFQQLESSYFSKRYVNSKKNFPVCSADVICRRGASEDSP